MGTIFCFFSSIILNITIVIIIFITQRFKIIV
nr:MAG TPA: hypothetical protein [Caudoviricetes sp.]DAZ63322.1 MAG TPA: hypothetical protein [Caudoviricetes sp.]